MSHRNVAEIRTTRFRSKGTAPRHNLSYVATGTGIVQLAETVLSAVCVGLVSYFGDRYYYDVEAQAAEWMLMVLKNVLKVEQMDVWKPVTFFLAVTAACLLNSFCLLVACVTSHATASKIAQTIYGVLYHFLAFGLCLAASVTLMVTVNKPDIRGYKNGYYHVPFLAAGIIGAILSGLYLLSTALSFRSYTAKANVTSRLEINRQVLL
ncbi:uncharacterized protein LOC110834914 [Zootermopsis nevadensis]|uniref:uncharacterized protein LOC110834914 n=1 Tax=Zootermopsis nevadensis TaxID=136037 RepID=UPI000B8E822D|nr:uncharacterized protein LOC110834914 [Zootermopsis nevadensis]